jgi:hypothetical protein
MSQISGAASQTALLYVTDYSRWDVDIYDYPAETPFGTLANLKAPSGECVDSAGNVYVVAEVAQRIFEYAHGGTRPIATFKSASHLLPVSCAFDPTTGDLAVANLEGSYSKDPSRGDVEVYQPGQQRPAKFTASNIFSYYFLGYDNKGNLFVDGSYGRAGVGVRFEYAELPRSGNQMQPITLTGGSIAFPGNVQWDGEHIAIGDQDNAVIYQTQGSQIVGSTPLTGSSDIVGYFIDGGTVICPDAGNGTVEFYNYPAGGTPTGSIAGISYPLAAAVSP